MSSFPEKKNFLWEVHVFCVGFGELGEAVGSVGLGMYIGILDDEIVGITITDSRSRTLKKKILLI